MGGNGEEEEDGDMLSEADEYVIDLLHHIRAHRQI